MREAERWRQTKFRIEGSKICASKNPSELAPSSRINADLIGEFYSRAIPKWVSGDLADLGCGKAPLFGAYGRYSDSVFLADWGQSLHGNPFLDAIIDMNKPLTEIESGSFDVVLLSDVLEHIEEPVALMSEISRILRPHGRLLMNVPFIYEIHEIPFDYFRYTRFALERIAVKSGLEVTELVPIGGRLEVMGDLWCKTLGRARLWPLVSVVHRAVIALHRTPFGQRLSARTGEVLPIGYGMIAQKPANH